MRSLTSTSAVREGATHVALVRMDPRADVALVATADRHDAILPGCHIAHDQGRDIDFEDVGDGTDDRFVGRRGIQAGVDGTAEASQAAEQLGTILERLPLTAERQGRGHAVTNDGHRVEIALVQLGVVAALDVEDAEHRPVDRKRAR